MPEPLKVILTVAAVAAGMYSVLFIRNALYTKEINPVYVLQIFLSFFGVLLLGLTIWGIVSLVRLIARKRTSSRTVTR